MKPSPPATPGRLVARLLANVVLGAVGLFLLYQWLNHLVFGRSTLREAAVGLAGLAMLALALRALARALRA